MAMLSSILLGYGAKIIPCYWAGGGWGEGLHFLNQDMTPSFIYNLSLICFPYPILCGKYISLDLLVYIYIIKI